ncbi:MAG: 2-phospho-L-lactate transferase [Candidatus Bathyarchaeota archaeon]|nr:2-phospho-L-lactate transferase [Candidatus Bathyarchaeota archaeon]MCZ2844950.1 2-phospho-L-lactate transferase [Candidatus Bathyarchaeota archaeon]
MIVALAGGVGAARFLQGLVNIHREDDITVIVNTGDDLISYGLYISPDTDIIMYTLAGIVDEKKGWGIKGDSFNCLEMLRRYGSEVWFNTGDMDLSTHILRTKLMKNGLTLSECTNKLSKLLGVKIKIIPMSNERVETRITSEKGGMSFQEYLVKRSAKDRVTNITFKGINEANPAPEVIESIMSADLIVVCPSNPFVSIKPILSIKGIEEALIKTKSPKISITPIIGNKPVKGPLDKIMRGLDLEISAFTVANFYRRFIDAFILDESDQNLEDRIVSLGIKVHLMSTLMRGIKEKMQIANNVLRIAKELKK